MGRRYIFGLVFVMLFTSAVEAEIIGIDCFDYPNGAIAGQAGGQYWDWDNTTKTHTGTVSNWNNLSGSAVIQDKALLTSGGNALREYNGPSEGSGEGTDERLGAFRGTGKVYYAVTMTQLAENDWCGFGSFDFGEERVFYGQPGGQSGSPKYFGIVTYANDGQTVISTIPIIPGQTYLLVAALDFDGDQVRLWVDPDADDWDNGASDNSADITVEYTATNWSSSLRLASGGQTQWDDCKIATTLIDLLPRTAMNPSPSNGQENVSLNVTLNWDPALDPNNLNQSDPAIVAHRLYANFANPSDPNLYFVAQISNTGERAQYGPLSLSRDKTYSWRVDEVFADANDVAGPVWVFSSLPSIPVIYTTSPVDRRVFAGETAQFAATAANPFEGYEDAVAYQWYSVSTGSALVDGAKFSGVQAAVLSVLDAQVADEDSFFCRVTNTYGNTASADTPTASLTVKRLQYYWPLDTDPNDVIEGVMGTPVGAPVLTEGKVDGAYQFASNEYIKLPAFDRPDYFTVTAWVKTTEGGDRHIWAWTNDLSEPTYTSRHAMLFRIQNGAVQYGEWDMASWRAVSGSSGLNNGEYQFVAVTYDKAQVKVYANGLQVGSGSVVGSTARIATQLAIANMGDRDPAGNSVRGAVDDVRFYNYALDRYQIADLYLGVAGGSVCLEGYPAYDYNRDCVVNLADFAIFAQDWMVDHRYFLQP